MDSNNAMQKNIFCKFPRSYPTLPFIYFKSFSITAWNTRVYFVKLYQFNVQINAQKITQILYKFEIIKVCFCWYFVGSYIPHVPYQLFLYNTQAIKENMRKFRYVVYLYIISNVINFHSLVWLLLLVKLSGKEPAGMIT